MEDYLTNLSDKELEMLKASFFSHAFDVLEQLGSEILRIENDPEDMESLKNIQRYVHTLKGDSASMGFASLSEAAHRLEDILHMLREKRLCMDRSLGDLLLSFVDAATQILTDGKEKKWSGVDTRGVIEKIDNYLQAGQAGRNKVNTDNKESACQLTEYQQLQAAQALKDGHLVYEIEVGFDPQCRQREVGAFMIKTQLSNLGEALCWAPDIEGAEIENADTVKTILITKSEAEAVRNACRIAGISADVKLNNLSLPPLNSPTHLSSPLAKGELKGCGGDRAAARHDSTLRVDAGRVDEIMNLVGELIIGRSMIAQSVYELRERLGKDETVANLQNIDSLFERSLSELQKGVMKIRMVPIDHVFRRFIRVVRDLSAEKGKEIRLEISGAETELDKGIIDVIGEPLIHMIRNCIDHGIEKKEDREKKGKDKCGVIRINSYHEGGQIIIEIEDDGKGIDIERVKEKAIENGIIGREDADSMNDEDAIDLIFHSGLSTAAEVTETSGRGIGMDAVRNTVEDLKGLIQVRSVPDKGARFTIRLPLTLAIIQGMVFSSEGKSFAFPLSSILEIRRVYKDEIDTINGLESIRWRNRVISILRLREYLNREDVKADNGDGKKYFVIIIGLAERRLGILVDRLTGKRELVIKAMDNGSDMISGASILGDGSIVLILDTASIIKRAAGALVVNE
ncbi:MAG: chemotaxis protein CheA [Nitrospirota bacterium]|jgi:two-component system chemotaxis sensor kinase CheA